MRERFWELICAFSRLYLIAVAVTASIGVLSVVNYLLVTDGTTRAIIQFNIILVIIALGIFGFSFWRCRDYYRRTERDGWENKKNEDTRK